MERRFGREIFGLFLLFFTLLLFLSLFTFDQADPSLNHAVSGSVPLHNKGGRFGAYLAGFLNDIFGCVSLLLPVALGAIGLTCVSRAIRLPWWRWAGLGILSLCLLVCCAAWNVAIGDLAGGGIVGAAIDQLARDLLSSFGATLLWLFLFFVGLQLLCDLSWKNLLLKGVEAWKARSEARAARAEGDASTFREQEDVSGTGGKGLDDAFDDAFDSAMKKARGESGACPVASSRPESGARRLSLPGLSALGGLMKGVADRLVRHKEREPMPDLAVDAGDDVVLPERPAAARPAPKRGKPRRRKVEKDVPFASLEDTGLPADSAFAPRREQDPDMGLPCEGESAAMPSPAPVTTPASARVTGTAAPGRALSLAELAEQGRSAEAREPGPENPVGRQSQPRPQHDHVLPDPEDLPFAPDAPGDSTRLAVPAASARHAAQRAAGPASQAGKGQATSQTPAELVTPWSEAARNGTAQAAPNAHSRVDQRRPAASRPATPTPKKRRKFVLPPLSLLDLPKGGAVSFTLEELRACGNALMTCLSNFNVKAQLVKATPGPVVTTYMLRPDAGVPVRVFQTHADDIALALKAVSVFVQAPVPGTDTVGIVIPNPQREIVNFREMAESSVFSEAAQRMALPLIIGKDTTGKPFCADLAKMPHLLVAGATGQGKSVGLNAMLSSLLLTRRPDELKLLLVDPKRVEMGMYEDEPHLIHPVVKEVEHAAAALQWAVQEMEHRYDLMAQVTTKNITGYNAKVASMRETGTMPPGEALEPMPYVVIVIDELADLMLQARKDVEPCIIRLAQLARACGIHMIIATQRPSVDVVTGLIKANFPCRISFKVSSGQDSRTTLGSFGAEKLLGMGDMFYLPNGGNMTRLHGPFLRDDEVHALVEHWKKQAEPEYGVDFSSWTKDAAGSAGAASDEPGVPVDDPMYREVLDFALENGKVSTSLIQRRFKIGFNKAARYMDQLDRDGYVGPAPGAGKPRPVIMH